MQHFQIVTVFSDCKNVQFLEHVHVMVDISSRSRRGEFTILLKSPSGTVAKLLAPRPLDNSISGMEMLQKYVWMSERNYFLQDLPTFEHGH